MLRCTSFDSVQKLYATKLDLKFKKIELTLFTSRNTWDVENSTTMLRCWSTATKSRNRVEQTLTLCKVVADVAVVRGADDTYGELPIVFVVREDHDQDVKGLMVRKVIKSWSVQKLVRHEKSRS
ncbi:hypothetical protein BJ878DRAFT_482465 [Calycina marina]|uniref:AMP-binding enzyme C-terminal domain-containing protein n=1 Tax=Calycina marina TaxID=1763456 RepID=A0A9P7YYX8_9HELO|nr:hypothetical protein BJ878DRAFT_482465 [Calycina marina]